MKILMSSYAFAPSVGGIEEVSELVAEEFVALGHSVKIVTMTPSMTGDDRPFEVVRRPSAAMLVDSVRWCDVYLQMNVNLRLAWPLVMVRRPWVVAIHAPLYSATGLARLLEFAKRASLRPAHVTAICEAMKRGTGRRTVIVPNPYRADIFRPIVGEPRINDLIFLGRLVPDKGAPVLLDALALLRKKALLPRLVIVGRGPEEAALRAQCARLRLEEQVVFSGYVPNEDVARLLNRSRIMVVPSVWEEGFGVVALQGIACGCVVVASHAGGLPEAVGPCGVTFPKGSAPALADRLAELLPDEAKLARLRTHAPDHLARHQPRAVAEAYLAVIEQARDREAGAWWRGGSSDRRSGRRA